LFKSIGLEWSKWRNFWKAELRATPPEMKAELMAKWDAAAGRVMAQWDFRLGEVKSCEGEKKASPGATEAWEEKTEACLQEEKEPAVDV
jgi:hypothetical protein